MTYWYSIPEVAQIFNVSDTTIRRLISADRLPAIQVGSQWRIVQDTLEAIQESGFFNGLEEAQN
jgi:excisionase family DNA binding protein